MKSFEQVHTPFDGARNTTHYIIFAINQEHNEIYTFQAMMNEKEKALLF